MYPLLKNARWTWTAVTCGLPSLWYWAEPIMRPPASWVWVAHSAVFAAFVALLYAGYRAADRFPALIVAAMTALAFLATPINGNASLFLAYAAGFVGAFRRPGISAVAVVALLIATAGQAWLLGDGKMYWTAMALLIVSIGAYSVFTAVSRRHNAHLGLKQEEIERLAKVAERERIARDLHDSLGNSLSVVAIKLRLAEKLIDEHPDHAKDELRQLQSVTSTALREIRDLVHGYGCPGVVSAIENGRLALEAVGIETMVSVKATSIGVATDQALGLAVREAITNIIRHADATHCRIRLLRDGSNAVLVVEDDGSGLVDANGFGIRSMQERIEGLGGRFELLRETGAKIKLTIPDPGRDAGLVVVPAAVA